MQSLADDWGAVAQVAATTGQKLMKVSVPVRHKIGDPLGGGLSKAPETCA